MAVYLKHFRLLSDSAEALFFANQRRTCYNNFYPFGFFPEKELNELSFGPITFLYGGNGSGKTTLLNVIAQKAEVVRHSAFSNSAFFQVYVDGCGMTTEEGIPRSSQILTSDDVFDYLQDIRRMNNGIDRRREELFEQYTDLKYQHNQLQSLDQYDQWKNTVDAKRTSQSRFVKSRLRQNIVMQSNGESALRYFVERIEENALYLLDEPENSLSIALQQELADFLQNSARYYGCQFIIATHSPILLSMKDAVIYDLDHSPIAVRRWTELENVRAFYHFFQQHEAEF